jgi:hypothetical protein
MSANTNTIVARALKIIEAAKRTTSNRSALSALDNIQIYHSGYAEPGYSSETGCIALGDWNDPSFYHKESGQFIKQDATLSRVHKLLEKLGVDLEWEDEWYSCENCGKLFRSTADSYGWTMSGVVADGSCYCAECVEEDADEHLHGLEGQDTRCNTIRSISPEDHGYVRLEANFAHGLYGGQAADPQRIGQVLRNAGVERYLFDLDAVGQFDMKFSVWVHESEDVTRAQAALDGGKTDGPDPATMMEKALKDASAKMAQLPDGQGVKYAQCNADGTAQVRLVSPEEFVRGIGKPAPEPESDKQ